MIRLTRNLWFSESLFYAWICYLQESIPRAQSSHHHASCDRSRRIKQRVMCVDPLEAIMSMRVTNAYRSGFTLIELLVVIAIIGILVWHARSSNQPGTRCSRSAQCQNKLGNFGQGLHAIATASARASFVLANFDWANVGEQSQIMVGSLTWLTTGFFPVTALSYKSCTSFRDYRGSIEPFHSFQLSAAIDPAGRLDPVVARMGRK